MSPNTAEKDYVDSAARCARLGVGELWVFDPLLVGPVDTGGPIRSKSGRRSGDAPASFSRVHAGGVPARSEELGAFLVLTDNGSRLRLANDPAGLDLWPTPEEAERARADAVRERAETAEAEVARLRRLLAERK